MHNHRLLVRGARPSALRSLGEAGSVVAALRVPREALSHSVSGRVAVRKDHLKLKNHHQTPEKHLR
jgi:hypothetical protein